MQPSTSPHAVGVEVVATQPAAADRAAIAHLSTTSDAAVAPVAYLVMVRLDPVPPASSQGWALYVATFRIPKYWEYRFGIYFKIFDPRFFDEHAGDPLRFSRNRTDYLDTGLVLDRPDVVRLLSIDEVSTLPLQADVLGTGG